MCPIFSTSAPRGTGESHLSHPGPLCARGPPSGASSDHCEHLLSGNTFPWHHISHWLMTHLFSCLHTYPPQTGCQHMALHLLSGDSLLSGSRPRHSTDIAMTTFLPRQGLQARLLYPSLFLPLESRPPLQSNQKCLQINTPSPPQEQDSARDWQELTYKSFLHWLPEFSWGTLIIRCPHECWAIFPSLSHFPTFPSERNYFHWNLCFWVCF